MGNVVTLPVVTTLDVEPGRVIEGAADAELAAVVIVGRDADGNEYFASSVASGPEAVWMLERAKLKLLRQVD